MNLQELWSGNDYAWWQNRGRGENYVAHAQRVKVIRTFKETKSYNAKATGYAEVLMCEDDGTIKTDYKGDHVTKKVRARDIAMRWDAYADERAHRQAQEKRRKQEREEQRRKEQELEKKLRELLHTKYNIPEAAIGSIAYGSIYLNRSVLEKELGLRVE